ncbi:MAG: hypothetical protein K9I99_03805 [Melioribacteraceae bacterium]|nr:hypothetical protein [Melioribacteraceae bacterium]
MSTNSPKVIEGKIEKVQFGDKNKNLFREELVVENTKLNGELILRIYDKESQVLQLASTRMKRLVNDNGTLRMRVFDRQFAEKEWRSYDVRITGSPVVLVKGEIKDYTEIPSTAAVKSSDKKDDKGKK